MFISVINKKGGVAKTTTAIHLAAGLARKGLRTLIVDLDPQASASAALGVEFQDLCPSAAEVLLGNDGLSSAIRSTGEPGLDLLPGSPDLAHADLALSDREGREILLAQVLQPIWSRYEHIVCDCPATLSLLTVNALTASDTYVVPLTPDYLSADGLGTLQYALNGLRAGLGLDLPPLGILFTMVADNRLPFRNRERKSQDEIMAMVRERFGSTVFETVICRDVSLALAASHGRTVYDYAPSSRAATQYSRFTEEAIHRCRTLPV